MDIKNDSNTSSQNILATHDAEFHIAFGWLAAIAVSIASAGLAIVT